MQISILELIECLATAMDLISPEVRNHHLRVAVAAHAIGRESGLPDARLNQLVIAALLHDVGGLTCKDRLELLHFEEHAGHHAEYGYRLLKSFAPTARVATFVRYHHTHWNDGNCHGVDGETVPEESHILYLADRIAVLVPQGFRLSQAPGIRAKIVAQSGSHFPPELVACFERLAKREVFWLDLYDAYLRPRVRAGVNWVLTLSDVELQGLGKLFSQIIDFRSAFTATHSSGVAVVSAMLAQLMGFSPEDTNLMTLAGHLHDIGKLVISEDILEKEGPLTNEEYAVVRAHTYYTDRLLGTIGAFDNVRAWAAYHHERLDGSGYPFHLKEEELSLGARIMAVADVCVALSEDRPYRRGMGQASAQRILAGMVASGSLDGGVVDVLNKHWQVIDRRRITVQRTARMEYDSFYAIPSERSTLEGKQNEPIAHAAQA